MTELETPPPMPVRAKPEANIYTVLVVTAFVALATATGIMWYKNVTLTGNSNPFYVVSK